MHTALIDPIPQHQQDLVSLVLVWLSPWDREDKRDHVEREDAARAPRAARQVAERASVQFDNRSEQVDVGNGRLGSRDLT